MQQGIVWAPVMKHGTSQDGAVPQLPAATRKCKKRTAAPPNVTNRPVTAAAAAALPTRRVRRAAAAAAAAGVKDHYRAHCTAQSQAAARKWRRRGSTRVATEASPPEPSFWHARAGAKCIADALPEELIGQILRQLPKLSDVGRARCVCKAWNQVGASPFHRPANPLWCLIPGYPGGGWRTIDKASERERKIDYPGITTSCAVGLEGRGGLVAVQEGAGKYWICNPLLNAWQEVLVSAAETLRIQQRPTARDVLMTTSELLVSRAQRLSKLKLNLTSN